MNGPYPALNKKPAIFDSYRISRLALFTALAVISRLLLQFLPNVQAVTVILILVSRYWGLVDSMLIASLTMLISNIYLGFGPWTLAQILAYLVLVFIIHLLTKIVPARPPLVNRLGMASLAFLAGLLYGFLISIVMVQMLELNHFWPYYLRGLSFDLAHAIGNFIFYLLLEPVLRPIMDKFAGKNKRV